jgi:hypothetical protein
MGCRYAIGDKESKNSRQNAGKGKEDFGWMDTQRRHSRYPEKCSLPLPMWPSA